ncbi:hypothetical protein GG804_21565 [Sphingomonas histidinilytica]|uniref:Uncharacterized protein n=1 Tax=Rhizorhabdus histidinilytica TaxID=439228 RepID=A0A1T5E4J2_9SPHN|nr:hypothetical protein [Rhizorhabdus histidinilytica]MBO9379365.1 hypothetical protein [Rhizorhabdus histidinilytica]SKB78784.1 hypothetical protein SAMN06295920_106167 [Rhizorhabdus histidinilytica]
MRPSILRLSAIRWTPAVGLGAGLGLMLATGLAWAGLDALAAARARLWTVEARASAGAVPVKRLLPVEASHGQEDRRTAEAALLAAIRGAAADRRLLLERVAPVAADRALPAELGADVTVSGPEADVLGFARAIETAHPAIRFARWRIGRTGPGETAIRLDARAMAVWEPR